MDLHDLFNDFIVSFQSIQMLHDFTLLLYMFTCFSAIPNDIQWFWIISDSNMEYWQHGWCFHIYLSLSTSWLMFSCLSTEESITDFPCLSIVLLSTVESITDFLCLSIVSLSTEDNMTVPMIIYWKQHNWCSHAYLLKKA